MQLSPRERESAETLIRTALAEDLQGGRDLTTQALIPGDAAGSVRILAREPGILAGAAVAELVFRELDGNVSYRSGMVDGERLSPGSLVAEVSGPVRSLLTGERTALNFLTLLSGTATLTRKFVDAVSGTDAKILDTRKTIPGLRSLQRYAVRCGGGGNHRFGLHDAVLIKDNHLAWWESGTGKGIVEAVRHGRSEAGGDVLLEVEVDSLVQLEQVLPAAPDVVLLDNMTDDELRQAVSVRNRTAPAVRLEASGGITLERAAAIAATGVDRISIGGLTHSAPALDIGLDWI